MQTYLAGKEWYKSYVDFKSHILSVKHGDMFFFFWVCKKNFFQKEQNHKFLNKSPRSNGEVDKFSENDLLYDMNYFIIV